LIIKYAGANKLQLSQGNVQTLLVSGNTIHVVTSSGSLTF
jgi:hypothetical protein